MKIARLSNFAFNSLVAYTNNFSYVRTFREMTHYDRAIQMY
jgi:hypothetical protein